MEFDQSQQSFSDFRKRVKEDPGSVIAIVGAGLSKPAGLPLWIELKDQLISDLMKQADELPTPEEIIGRKSELGRLKSSKDNWYVFSGIQRLYYKHAFQMRIKELLTRKKEMPVPKAYIKLWQLGIKGMISFNLDTNPLDAFEEATKRRINFAAGREEIKYSQYLSSLEQFVFYPHGYLMDPKTWAFTQGDRQEILALQNYKKFFEALFLAKTVILLGFNPEDFSFEYLLQGSLAPFGENAPTHYILCPDPTPEQCAWLDTWHFLPIKYTPSNNQHLEVEYFLDLLLSFTSRDPYAPSVYEGMTITHEKAYP